MVPLFNCIFHDDFILIPVYSIRFLNFMDTMVKISKKSVTFFFLNRLGVNVMNNDS